MGKEKQALLKNASDLRDCEEGKEVVLIYGPGNEFTGIFIRLDGNDIIIKSTTSDHRIGLPYESLKGYLESI